MARTDRGRPPLKVRLSSPGWKRFFRILRWVLGIASAALLVLLLVTVLTQPSDRSFSRPEEWLAIGLIALPAVFILLCLLIRRLLSGRRGKPKARG